MTDFTPPTGAFDGVFEHVPDAPADETILTPNFDRLAGRAHRAFPNGVATPSVAGGTYWYCANAGTVVITNFLNGKQWQLVRITLDGNTSIAAGEFIDQDIAADSGARTHTFLHKDGAWWYVGSYN